MTGTDTPAPENMDRRLPTIPREEIARLGDGIYEREIRPLVEAEHNGEVVAIDVESGRWAISAPSYSPRAFSLEKQSWAAVVAP